MKTDRELLELAAKAAGIDARRLPDAWPNRFDDDQWNPLIDDGDALRLAVRLDQEAAFCVNAGKVECQVLDRGSGQYFWRMFTELGNDAAATRRAIVRAAAAIGEAA